LNIKLNLKELLKIFMTSSCPPISLTCTRPWVFDDHYYKLMHCRDRLRKGWIYSSERAVWLQCVGLIPRSAFKRILKPVCWWFCDWLSDVLGLLRFVGLKSSGQPPLWYSLRFRLSPCDYGMLCSKELLCLLLCSGGCWYVDLETILTIDPFAKI